MIDLVADALGDALDAVPASAAARRVHGAYSDAVRALRLAAWRLANGGDMDAAAHVAAVAAGLDADGAQRVLEHGRVQT